MTPQEMNELIKRTVEAAEKASGHRVLSLVLQLPDKTLLVIDAKRHVTVLNPPVELPKIKPNDCSEFGLSENPSQAYFPRGTPGVGFHDTAAFKETPPETPQLHLADVARQAVLWWNGLPFPKINLDEIPE